jgi:hypothetical protein
MCVCVVVHVGAPEVLRDDDGGITDARVCWPRLPVTSTAKMQHLTNLLAAPVPEVAAAALQTFQVLVRKTHHTSVRWTPPVGLTQRLLALSKGWGGKDEVSACGVCGQGYVQGCNARSVWCNQAPSRCVMRVLLPAGP